MDKSVETENTLVFPKLGDRHGCIRESTVTPNEYEVLCSDFRDQKI